jgi:predicted enzyme related to lactoylglutathione lyase
MAEQPTPVRTAPLNTVTWWELPVSDVERAKAFYGALFGWTFSTFAGEDGDDASHGEFVGAYDDGELVGGLYRAEGDPTVAPAIRVYLNVADLEAVLATAESLGGTVRTPRQDVGGGMGWWAQISDPDGRWIGLCTDNPPRLTR